MGKIQGHAAKTLPLLESEDLRATIEQAIYISTTNGLFVIDHAAVFIIIIVLAGIALTLLSNYVETDFATALKDKINALFNI